jgi:hypothetical protein
LLKDTASRTQQDPTFWIKDRRAALSRLTKTVIRHTFDRHETTPAERDVREVFREVMTGNAMTDYEKAQKSFHENRKRLKAERLAREAEARTRSSD